MSDNALTPEEWRANTAALAGCARPHRFVCVKPRDDETGARARYRCKVCTGCVGETNFAWYSRGIIDGQKIEKRRVARREATAA